MTKLYKFVWPDLTVSHMSSENKIYDPEILPEKGFLNRIKKNWYGPFKVQFCDEKIIISSPEFDCGFSGTTQLVPRFHREMIVGLSRQFPLQDDYVCEVEGLGYNTFRLHNIFPIGQ